MEKKAIHETYLKDTPWIVCQWLMNDAEADANGGNSEIGFICCICGRREVKGFYLPPEGDPIWKEADPDEGLPEAKRIKQEFQLSHLHPGRHQNPMLDWELPLLNPAALGSTGLSLGMLMERLKKDLEGA